MEDLLLLVVHIAQSTVYTISKQDNRTSAKIMTGEKILRLGQ